MMNKIREIALYEFINIVDTVVKCEYETIVESILENDKYVMQL